MRPLVECVPNFSEGRDKEKIEAIMNEIRAVKDCWLLDVDPGADTNRTVTTFVGTPQAVVEAAFRATKKAAELIDMRGHKGEHKRMGATDVVPFVPVQDVSVAECIACAEAYGKRVADELGIPIYLYSLAARKPERVKMPDIRKGEYEALPEKLKDPSFAPDFGEAVFNAQSGATVTGARKFLIAWNVNVKNPDKTNAHKVALMLRESGQLQKDAQGNKVLDDQGKPVRIPGRFKNLQGMGFDLPEHGISQLSFNITDLETTPMHEVYEACKTEMAALGESVTGSELVGLIPLAPMLAAGRYYAPEEMDEARLVRIAIDRMGLSDLQPFDPNKKIVEWIVRDLDRA